MGAVMGSGGNVRHRYFQSEHLQIAALVAMISTAKSMGIGHGVALVLCRRRGDKGVLDLKFDAVGNTFFGIRTNYLAIAMAKLAVAMRLGVDKWYRYGRSVGW